MNKSNNNKKGKISANVVATLKEYDKTLKDDISVLGVSGLTQFDSVSAGRTQMFNAHTKQCVVLLAPEHPYIYTSMENTVGEHNNAFKRVKNESTVFRKIVKFEDIVDNPHVYTLFLFDNKKKKFKVITRKDCEDLTENFGYDYNNEVIDSFSEGDIIKAGTILNKSTSYDEYMNYGYGVNALVQYTTDPMTSEDAAIISESFARRCSSIETEEISVGMNDNDFLLNLYGDSTNYKPFPDIGETANGYLVATRRQFNDQLLFDFKEESLNKIMDGDIIKYISENNEIIDIQIYSNNEEIIDTPFNAQINKYLRSQNNYYKEIYDTCEEIIKICEEDESITYSGDIGYLYKRSKDMLDTTKKWKEGDSAFSNVNIKFTVRKVAPLTIGSKITGRYGNKSVVSKIVPDDQMPYTKDGRRVEVLLNTLAIINRTTAFVLFEMMINNITYKVRKAMINMNSYRDREKLLFDILYMLNEKQYHETHAFYDKMTIKEQREFIDDAIKDGIYIRRIPMMDDRPIFYKISDVLSKYSDIIQPDEVFINKWGRPIKMLNKQWIGEMYIMKLKQTSKRGFSARSTGAINGKGLPSKDKKNKDHTERISQTPIRIGEAENANMRIGADPEELMLFNALYSSSIKGRHDIVSAMFKNEGPDGSILHHIDKSYTLRTAEIFDVLLKSLGIRLDFINKDNIVKPLDDSRTLTFINTDTDEINICTEYQKFIYDRISEIEKDILLDNPIMTKDELAKEVEKRMRKNHYVMGPLYDKDGNLDI